MSDTFDITQLDAKSKPLPTNQCPTCGYKFDCASIMENDQTKRPRPGDFSLCLKCGEIFVFQPDMSVREPTIMEFMQLDREETLKLKFLQEKIREERPLGT